VKKDGLPEKAQAIIEMLRLDFTTQYDEKDSIGKRYRRQDAIGTPFAITVDHESLENNTVTIRNRDTMLQERMAIDALPNYLHTHCSWSALLSNLG
jgi:glycyl-tRNA synthetase